MMDDAFSIQLLTEKLTNLNNSQQSIETLSSWCIIHRKKAKQVIETWEKLFNSFPKEKRVPLMYLANDILQNSRRKGSDFVNEFWKVLPRSLKRFLDNGDEREKNIVTRLVYIWEERKVFGSRLRTLKDELLGNKPIPIKENNVKGSQLIKIVKKDANSLRIKLALGCVPEKIVSSFLSVLDEQSDEDNVLNKYKAALDRLAKLEKDIDGSQGNQHLSLLMGEFLEQETILNQCINQLENMDATRTSLISHLKEALTEQEDKLGDLRLQLQLAKVEADRMSSLRQKVASASVVSLPVSQAIPLVTLKAGDANTPNHIESAVLQHPVQQFTTFMNPPMPSIIFPNSSTNSIADHNLTNHFGNSIMPPMQSTTFANSTSSTEDQNKKAAAAVAAKLAAMTSSAQVLSSVLSSFVAEEAASMNGSMKVGRFTSSSPLSPMEKRPKLERPMQMPDSQTVLGPQVPQQLSSMPLGLSQASASSLAAPLPINPLHPPFPPPLIAQAPPYNSGGIATTTPFSFGGTSISLPPPPPARGIHGLVRSVSPLHQPPPPPLQPPQSLHQAQQQMLTKPPQPLLPPQQHSMPGFFPPPGMGFFSQPHSASTGPPQAHQR